MNRIRVSVVSILLLLLVGAVGFAAPQVMQTNVVVVGGGGAGLTAALSAAEQGADVILLEKMAYMGGATLMSGGIVPAVGTSFQEEAGVEDSVDAFARDILRPSHYSVRQDLVFAVAEEAKEIIEWMEKLGVQWSLITEFLYAGQTNYRMAEGAGVGLTNVLIENVQAHEQIEVLLSAPGIRLLTDSDGTVTGVITEKNGEEITIIAESVILATSGFAANQEILNSIFQK